VFVSSVEFFASRGVGRRCTLERLAGTLVKHAFPTVEPLFTIIEGFLARIGEAVTSVGAFFPLVRKVISLVGQRVACVGDGVALVCYLLAPVVSGDRVRGLG
jgi:hypothetical protein